MHGTYTFILKPSILKGVLIILQIDWEAAEKSLKVDRSVGPVSTFTPGYKAGVSVLEEFCNKRIKLFGTKRNDPTINALSNLSPYFHFGKYNKILKLKEDKFVVK